MKAMKKILPILIITVMIFFAAIDNQEQKIESGILKVHFIDVGQADSILIQNNEQAMLIDAGNNSDSDAVVSYIKAQNIKRLDYVVGTHPHEDHIGGLDSVIKSFDIGIVYMPKVMNTTKTFLDVLSAVKEKGLKVTAPKPNVSFELGGDAICTIIAPNGSSYGSLNDYSIVIKVTHEENSFLFTGDAEEISEKEMIEKGFSLVANVLKIAHHGSNSSTIQEFLDQVNPKYAIISVGEGNKYGHPDKIVMDRLKDRGTIVYRTDKNGTIVATSDGKIITFTTNRGSYSK